MTTWRPEGGGLGSAWLRRGGAGCWHHLSSPDDPWRSSSSGRGLPAGRSSLGVWVGGCPLAADQGARGRLTNGEPGVRCPPGRRNTRRASL
ncbi:hypothetical protein Rumeso_04878 [Rubellimicrobium mesophilum DSM 19309]|uniref:Uncharacterized protein n=1 Tax=Rubellimicrobium mesophilum DSM 19309 TaxID=442562 RepID=A0A017HDA8_9RHOB|nr:hypothetical protein Rumeso_04878 [Rubellimicrobium mesophilum DSM 19309]